MASVTRSPLDTPQDLACGWHPVDTCGIALQDEKKAAKMRGLSSFDESLDPTFGVVIDAFRPSGLPPTFLFMEPLSFSGKLRGPWDGCAVLAYLPSASMAGVAACPHSPPVPPTQIMSPLLPPFS